MAKTSMKVRCARGNKFPVREYTRCERCGRPHRRKVYRIRFIKTRKFKNKRIS